MAQPPDSMVVQAGAFKALGWFFLASKDAFVALQGETVKRANPAWTAITGHAEQESVDRPLWDFIVADDLPNAQPGFAKLSEGGRFECEVRLNTKSRREVWARIDFVGGAEGWRLVILRDVTAERRLRQSEARFRGLVNATSDVVYRMSPDWREMRELDGRGFIADTESPRTAWIDEYLLPEDRPRIQAAIEAAIAHEDVFELEHRVRRVDGSTGWTVSRALPVRDETGAIAEWFGAASDVTERHRAEEHLRLVVHELNHRVKNNLAMMEAAASQSFRHATSLEEARDSLMARLEALVHASRLLAGDARVGTSLRGIIEEALRPHCDDPDRYSVSGPELALPPRNAHTFALAIHELATNAVKHGAWSNERGLVDVTWTAMPANAGRRLHLEWRERGGPQVSPPARRGFGSRLVERGLAGEFGGEAKLSFEPSGVVCVLDAQLAA